MKIQHTLILIGLCALFQACKDGNPVENEELITAKQQEISNDVLELERFINELEFIARSIKIYHPNQPGILMGATISKGQTEEGKKKYDILFNNITGSDDKKRSGKLSVVFEDAVENGNTVLGKHLHVRSDDDTQLFSVAGIRFKGSLIFSNISNSDMAITDHLNAQSFLINPAGDQIRFSSARKSKWKAGNATPDIADDVFELSDQHYSLNIANTTNEFVNVEPGAAATLQHACSESPFLPKAGKLAIEHLGGKSWTINLGNGDCSTLPALENSH